MKSEIDLKKIGILLTGCAGFIGFSTAKKLLEEDVKVLGLDNMNDYYDVSLKKARLRQLEAYDSFSFIRGDIADKKTVDDIFLNNQFDYVINLAAQAGVRYSIENPQVFIDCNITGFFNILEACRHNPIKRLIYASSSSVYGGSTNYPYSLGENVNSPVSLYAATKLANELMAHSYYEVFGLPSTGLRFFTVYGPWGRPDMAYFLFTKGIMESSTINVFNHGKMERDFTYIDDIVDGILRVIVNREKKSCDIYNLGNSSPVKLMDFIKVLEDVIGKKAVINHMGMQPGDVVKTAADISRSTEDLGYIPKTSIETGLHRFVEWYREYESTGK